MKSRSFMYSPMRWRDAISTALPRMRKFVLLYDQREPGSKSSGRVAYRAMTVSVGSGFAISRTTKSSG